MLRSSPLLAVLWLCACGPVRLDGSPGDGSLRLVMDPEKAAPVDCTAEQAAVDALTQEARALAVAGGCTDVAQCASAAFGAKACGGPEGYLVFCVPATDRPALEAKLAALEERERRFNVACGMASTCDVVQPPALALDATGRCRAQ